MTRIVKKNLKIKESTKLTETKKQKVANKIHQIYANKKLRITVGLISIVVFSFLAGMGFNSLISKSDISSNVKSNSAVLNSSVTKELVKGVITKIELPEISVRANSGEIKTVELVDKSIIRSADSKTVQISEVKVGDSVLIYANKSQTGKLSIDRLRVVE